MKLEPNFRLFIQNILIGDEESEKLKKAHETLKSNLKEYSKDTDFKELIISEFVQGSFKRKTCLKSRENKPADIDVVVVTKMDESEFNPPHTAQAKFLPFVEKYYKGQYELQGRSIGVTLKEENVDLDIVITSNPKEAQVGFLAEALIQNFDDLREWDEEIIKKSMKQFSRLARVDNALSLSESNPEDWKIDPLRIPDREAKNWQDTNPLAQVFWTIRKNQNCNNLFLPVVRSIKWLRGSFGGFPKYPKGYPLEHIVGDCCPEGIVSIAEGVVLTLEKIVSKYQNDVDGGRVPYLKDRGVDTNVLSRQSVEDFKAFHSRINQAAIKAREAMECEDSYESSVLWRELLGDDFPLSEKPEGGKKFESPKVQAEPETKRRFA
jgi:hypothetical protein